MCGRFSDDAVAVASLLAVAKRVLIVTHARPDGDAMGSMAALASAARTAGKTVRTLVPGDVPDRWGFLFPDGAPAGAGEFAALADEADLVVVVDTCAFAQLDGLSDALRTRREKIVVVDHHATGDDIGVARWVDPSAAAAGVMTLELIEHLGWGVSPAAAEALLTAMTTDTGWFRFSNADGRCLRAAARLFDTGIRPDGLYARLYQADRPERLGLLTRALASLRFDAGGRVATMRLRAADFAATGARADEAENFVNEALRVGSVEVAVLLVETPECIRASLRSRGGVDVSAVARQFDGGGHARAAGLRRPGDLDTLADELIDACARALGDPAGR